MTTGNSGLYTCRRGLNMIPFMTGSKFVHERGFSRLLSRPNVDIDGFRPLIDDWHLSNKEQGFHYSESIRQQNYTISSISVH